MTTALMSTYSRMPVTFERGEGVWLWDTAGRKYLDLLSGIAVCGLGHAHPAVTAAICEQAGLLLHTSNLYEIGKQALLAEKLVQVSSMDGVFFCNSGAEANEAAVKIARLFGRRKGVDLPEIIVAEGSFHGRTLATLSATGNRKVQAGFEPLVQGFVRVPYNSLEAIETVGRQRSGAVAVLLEPVEGEGGIVVPDAGYLAGVRALCDEHNWLFMLDEVQSGLGRTGAWFAWQHHDAMPDVITVAKSLGNGVPIGACMARGEAAQLFQPGAHGSTFGGNPLACSAAIAVIDTIEGARLVQWAGVAGTRLMNGLKELLQDIPEVVDIRGQGLMIGIELDRPCQELVGKALADGLLINVTAERVIRLLPPLIIQDAEIDQAVTQLKGLVEAFLHGR